MKQSEIKAAATRVAARQEIGIDAPITITLPPRLSAAVRWYSYMQGRPVEQTLLLEISEVFRDTVVCYGESVVAKEWLVEGSVAEGEVTH